MRRAAGFHPSNLPEPLCWRIPHDSGGLLGSMYDQGHYQIWTLNRERPPQRVVLLCTAVWLSIGSEHPVPKEIDHCKIAVRVSMMNKMQFLSAPEPCKPLKP